jgi:NADP-dependent 3-hydroxy acid dehydrogenase YdfG
MVVIGASSGIGRALATAAASAGWRLLLVARRRERLEEAQAQIRGAGGTAEVLVADVCAAETPQRIVDASLRAFARIDVIVNNAGCGASGALLEQSDAALEARWQVQVAAPLRLARAALPSLRATRGALVFVGSGLARVPSVRAAAAQLQRELLPDGIAVTYVDPGSAAARPERVARTMLRGIERRRRVVHAVPLHSLARMLAQRFPPSSDAPIERAVAVPEPLPATPNFAPTAPSVVPVPSEFEEALAPLARRMERVKLSPAFVRGLLESEERIELGEAAMRWAGMPNKNERAALREVLDALAAAGYLESDGEETWIVRRAPA